MKNLLNNINSWNEFKSSVHGLNTKQKGDALRRRLETNGNYQLVAKELGHKSAIVTEKYQRCDEKKLKDDFPSYKAIIESLENGAFNGTSTTNTSTNSNYTPIDSSQ